MLLTKKIFLDRYDAVHFVVLCCLLLVCLLLTIVPQIDLAISDYLYGSTQIGINHNLLFSILYYYAWYLIIIGLFFVLIYSYVVQIPKRSMFMLLGYCFLVLILLNGVVVSYIFKELFGRARPRDILEFGGTAMFTPALYISKQCLTNCSFVSGHASIGFFIATLGNIFISLKLRLLFLFLGLALGFLIGYARVVVGAHFMSDIVFCGFFMLLGSFLLYKMVRF